MIILRQKEFANKQNKEMVRDWKLRQRIKGSGVVDEINKEREAKVQELTKGQKGFLGFGKPHATKLTEEEVFQQAKGGRRALEDQIKYKKGVQNYASRFEGENPELFKKVNKNSAARSLDQVGYHDGGINTRINNKGKFFQDHIDKNGKKTTSGRAHELGLTQHGKEKYHMSGAEYHAKKAAEKKAQEEAAKKAQEEAAKKTAESTTKTTTKKVAEKKAKTILPKLGKKGKIGLAIGTGVAATGLGAGMMIKRKKSA